MIHRTPIPRSLLPLSLLALLAAASSCADQGDPAVRVAQRHAPIINGTPEYGQDAVVYILHQSGFACTGTVIGSRVILTAKHCVSTMDQNQQYATGKLSVSGFGIWVGQQPQITPWNWNPKYTITETRTTDGNTITDNDIAVMITAQPMEETPYPIISSYPSDFVGSQVQLIGYGLDGCGGGNSGAKLRTTDQVTGYEGFNSFISQGKGIASGDSGGPAFDLSYRVVGVNVAVPADPYTGREQCGTSIHTRIDHFRTLIQTALDDTGGCFPTGPEECGDNKDNDCNGLVDDGCNPTGAACQTDNDCASRFCADFGGSKTCSEPCDPWNPTGACGGGSYCKMVSCDQGACMPGSAGAKAAGEACGQDTDCQSLLCQRAADGNAYCAIRCTLDAGECMASEVCSALGDTCGACLASTLAQGPRGTGELCQLGANCRSGLCINDEGASYCSIPCQTDAACPDAFHCREGHCVRGEPGDAGDPCLFGEDCGPGLVCYADGDVSYCTEEGCGACPDGMSCTQSAGATVCTVDAATVGARCTNSTDCFTGSCMIIGGEALCTQPCSLGLPCPTGTYCTVSDSGALACAPNSLPPATTPPGVAPKKHGCQTAGDGSAGGLFFGLLGLALWWRRRRRR